MSEKASSGYICLPPLNYIVTYVLNNMSSKMPIEVSELSSLVYMSVAEFKRQLLPAAIKTLQDHFNVIMKAVPNSKRSQFICHPKNVVAVLDYVEEGLENYLLLSFILSQIYLSKRPIYEEDIFKYLLDLDINVDEEHFYYGKNLRELITETFVKQLYLKKTKARSKLDTEDRFIYTWGFRSSSEFTKLQVMKFPSNFISAKLKELQDGMLPGEESENEE